MARECHGDTEELTQEGVFGLNKALDGYDPDRFGPDGRRYRFADYARPAIKTVLAEYFREQKRLTRGDSLARSDFTEHEDTSPLRDIELPPLDSLTTRERDIIEKRYLNGKQPRRVIGAHLAISAERVRQIELTAFGQAQAFGQ